MRACLRVNRQSMVTRPRFMLRVQAQPAHAQTFRVLYNFTDGADGATPNGIAMDAAGNLYGTTLSPGSCFTGGCGGVFRLARSGSGWILSSLYHFQGGADGSWPHAAVTVASDGSLYGTTTAGGGGSCSLGQIPGCGTVYRPQPPPNQCPSVMCPWNETIIHSFARDPINLPYAALSFDSAGNLFGTAIGPSGGVFQMKPSGGGWTFDVLHIFTSSPDGALPYGAVTLDPAGNVFGTTESGGGSSPNNHGTVFEVSPSGSGWTESVLYTLTFVSGIEPFIGLVRDPSGNLYGAAGSGGSMGGGTIFELSPSGGSYSFSVIYQNFPEDDGGGAGSRLVMDQAGNLYGTAGNVGAHGQGMVYKLSRNGSSWTLTDLHDFNGSDGYEPEGDIVRDANGNIYGTTYAGGAHGFGVVWEITP
jgi:uncharacterized repeat protein (TIGR03803 family)